MLRKNVENEKSSIKFLAKTLICFFVFFMLFFIIQGNGTLAATAKIAEDPNKGEYLRLSDELSEDSIPYRKESHAGWGNIKVNQDLNGNKLAIKIENAFYQFDYGILAHASSEVYYDVSEYSEKYPYLTLYVGMNQTSSAGNGVKVYIYTSDKDQFYPSGAQHWTLKNTETADRVVMPGQNAVFEKIDIRGAKYIRLQAYDNGSNGNDHIAYVEPMLITENYKEDAGSDINIKTVAEYDEILKSKELAEITSGEYELTLLQRELVNKVGEYALKRYLKESDDNEETLSWLMNDVDALRLYISGGEPNGASYFNSLTQLTRLLKAYKSDFEDKTSISDAGIKLLEKKGLNWDTTKGSLYKRMAITLSLTHSARVNLWMQASEHNLSDAVDRYKIYKDLYNNGQFKATDTVNITPWFETFSIEEMRWILGTNIDDEEIVWLNEYTQSKIDKNPGSAWGLLTPHSYMAYVWPNYSNPVYYDEANKDYFNELFAVEKKNADGTVTKKGLFDYIPYRNGTPYTYKLWMNFRNKFGTGAVCGGISKSGHCIRGVHAIPSAVIGQPGHAAILYYTQNTEGKGYWGIDNDVSGWNYSEKGERMPLGWGNDRTYVRGYNVPYVILAQEALNDYENLEKAEKLVKLADVYKDDKAKQEQIYREAIKAQSINLDAWAGLAKLYVNDETKTEEDYYNLEKEMMEALKYFPFPMYNLSNYIKTKITSVEYSFKFTVLQAKILNEAKDYKGSAVLQPNLTRGFAAHLLGQIDTSLASFSFDGEDAGKIVLSSRFDGNGVRWDYSLDGKQTWKEVAFDAQEEHKLQLTTKELNDITAENDIYVHIVGANYSEENLYKIDIFESAGLPSTLYANDLENKLIASVPSMQWKYREEDDWTFYGDEEPDLTGNKTVIVRMGRTGTYLESKTSTTYEFTTNIEQNARKYIPIEHLSIHGVSTEATSNGGAAVNGIDGNMNTRYHSAWNGSDTQRYIIVKIDRPVYLSAVEYVPAAGGNGKIVDGTIWGSMDGENWEVLTSQKNLTYNPSNVATNEQAKANTKPFEIESLRKVQYVKIVADRTNGNWFAARMFNFYESTEVSAMFSFDGANAGKIILADEYQNVNWQYCIDGTNWKNGNGASYQLSREELEQVNENDNIKIRFDGNEKVATINIQKGSVVEQNVYVNDWENRLIGIANIDRLEWKLANSEEWTSYQEQEPIVGGKNTLLIRTKATGIYAASDVTEYEFTADADTETAKYIPIKHLSIHGYSSQSKDSKRPFYAPNVIDGNRNTLWHTDFAVSIAGQRAYVTIKLDSPKYISAMEFVQKKYRVDDPSLIQNMIVSVSSDGENWTEIGRKENCEQDEEFKRIDFAESMEAQYVKLEMEAYEIFASLAMVNLYEDTTKVEKVKGDIDGDGRLTVNDIALLKLHLIDIELLEGEQLEAADIDGDGRISINDMAQMKLKLLE